MAQHKNQDTTISRARVRGTVVAEGAELLPERQWSLFWPMQAAYAMTWGM